MSRAPSLRNSALLKLEKGILCTGFNNLGHRSWQAEHWLGSASAYTFNQVSLYRAHLVGNLEGHALRLILITF